MPVDTKTLKQCVRCHCNKPICDYMGVRREVKTCKRCRMDSKKNAKNITKAKRAEYNRTYNKTRKVDRATRNEYMRKLRARKKAQQDDNKGREDVKPLQEPVYASADWVLAIL